MGWALEAPANVPEQLDDRNPPERFVVFASLAQLGTSEAPAVSQASLATSVALLSAWRLWAPAILPASLVWQLAFQVSPEASGASLALVPALQAFLASLESSQGGNYSQVKLAVVVRLAALWGSW